MNKLKFHSPPTQRLIGDYLEDTASLIDDSEADFIYEISAFNSEITAQNLNDETRHLSGIYPQNLLISSRKASDLVDKAPNPISIKKIDRLKMLQKIHKFNEIEETANAIATELSSLMPTLPVSPIDEHSLYSQFYSGEKFSYNFDVNKTVSLENAATIPELQVEDTYYNLGRPIVNRNEMRSHLVPIILNEKDEQTFLEVFGAAYKSFDIAGFVIGIRPELLLHYYYSLRGTKNGKTALLREKFNFTSFVAEENFKRQKPVVKKKSGEAYNPNE